MGLGERGRLLPGPRRHRPDEDGEERQRRRQHDHRQYRSYGGLPVELGVVHEEDTQRKKLPSVTQLFSVALIAGVLLISAAMVANTLVRPSLPPRRGRERPVLDSSSGINSSPAEVDGLEGAEQQHKMEEVGVVDGSGGTLHGGMSDLFLHANNENRAAPSRIGAEQGATTTSRSSSSSSNSKRSNSNNNNNNNNNQEKSSSRDSVSEGGGAEEQQQQQQQQPNVIFILIDDAGMNDIGGLSTDLQELAPFMDSLSSQGVRLTKYYTNQLCTPSRASLMTGRDTFRTGMQYEVVEDAAPWGLPLEETTLAERFKAAGYATHMSGKWHLGMFSERHYPFSRGFDTFLGYMGGAEGYRDHVGCEEPDFLDNELVCFNDFGYGDYAGYIDYTANTTRWGPRCQGTYSTTLITDRAIDVATTHKAQNGTENPLFLYVAYQAVHDPVTPPSDDVFTAEEKATLERVVSQDPWRKKFARVMFYLDKELRRLHDSLDALGLLDDAVIVLASDNGACPIRGGSNYPYRGFKHTLFEGGVRVPAFVYSKSPDLVPVEARGSTYDGMMHSTDWTPTIASFVPNLPLEGMGLPLSGFDQWDAIIGRRSEELDGPVRRDLVLGMSSYNFDTPSHSMVPLATPRGAFISDGWKVILGDRCTEWVSFNPADLALAEDLGCQNATLCTSCTSDCADDAANRNDFLFHVESDPHETVNLKDAMPDKFDHLVEMWKQAAEDEVFPSYMPAEPEALQRWSEFNDWVVAWR